MSDAVLETIVSVMRMCDSEDQMREWVSSEVNKKAIDSLTEGQRADLRVEWSSMTRGFRDGQDKTVHGS